jgi:multiple sugar transport system substrate-binding protein
MAFSDSPRRRPAIATALATAALALSSVGVAADNHATTLGSNEHEDVPRTAVQNIVDYCEEQAGIEVEIAVNDHNTFQNQISAYLQGTPDDVVKWFAGNRVRFFANQGLLAPINDVWDEILQYQTEGLKEASTGIDGNQYFVPVYNYPWVVMYRKSLWDENSYTVPTTMDEFKALGDQMLEDGIAPLALGDLDGWPAMGTFDIINMRQNGYDFHIGLMEGREQWSDERVKRAFEIWRDDVLPYTQEGAAGRTWQDAAKAALVDKTAGMYFLGTFAAEQAAVEDIPDIGFFPWPALGTEFDAENAIDAPIDGFMLSANPKNPEAAKAFLKCVATPEAQLTYVLTPGVGSVAVSPLADPSGYNTLQAASAEVLREAGNIAQFLDRDARADFAGPSGMQGFLLDFLNNPNQDLDSFLTGIQAYYDSLPPEG